jgi:hypothetical protein
MAAPVRIAVQEAATGSYTSIEGVMLSEAVPAVWSMCTRTPRCRRLVWAAELMVAVLAALASSVTDLFLAIVFISPFRPLV